MWKLRTSVVTFPNAFVTRKTENNTYEAVEGFEYELLKVFAKALNFEYEIVTPKESEWGDEQPDGTWTGIMGMLHRNEADISIDTLFHTDNRPKIIDLSYPYHLDRLTFAIKVAQEKSKDFVYFYPFDNWVWMGFVLSILACSFFLPLLGNFGSRTKGKQCRYLYEVLMSIEIFLGCRDFENLPQTAAKRVLLTMVLLSARVITLSYAGIFLSFLMAPIMDDQIDTMAKLANASYAGQVKVTTFQDLRSWLPVGNQFLGGLTKYINEDPDAMIKLNDDPIHLILDGFALINRRMFQEIEKYTAGVEKTVFVSTDHLRLIQLSVAFKKKFCCVDRFNTMVHRIWQAGIYDKILEDHMFRLRMRAPRFPSPPSVREIVLADVVGAVWIVIPCYTVAITAFIIEHIVKANKKKRAGSPGKIHHEK